MLENFPGTQVTAGFQVRLLPCLAFLPVLSCFPPSCFSESTHSVNHLPPDSYFKFCFLRTPPQVIGIGCGPRKQTLTIGFWNCVTLQLYGKEDSVTGGV